MQCTLICFIFINGVRIIVFNATGENFIYVVKIVFNPILYIFDNKICLN